jgi:PPOX class probable F420-dependent enzyme
MRMIEIPTSARALIESGTHGHLTTLNADGWPQQTVVWVGIEDGELCVPSLTPRLKLRNVERDPRVVVTFESPDGDGATGLRFYLGVRGRARVTEGGAPAMLRELALRYLEPGVKFPRGDDPPEGWIIRIAPERIYGYGPWTES